MLYEEVTFDKFKEDYVPSWLEGYSDGLLRAIYDRLQEYSESSETGMCTIDSQDFSEFTAYATIEEYAQNNADASLLSAYASDNMETILTTDMQIADGHVLKEILQKIPLSFDKYERCLEDTDDLFLCKNAFDLIAWAFNKNTHPAGHTLTPEELEAATELQYDEHDIDRMGTIYESISDTCLWWYLEHPDFTVVFDQCADADAVYKVIKEYAEKVIHDPAEYYNGATAWDTIRSDWGEQALQDQDRAGNLLYCEDSSDQILLLYR